MPSLTSRIASKFNSLGKNTEERLFRLPQAIATSSASRFLRFYEIFRGYLLGLPKACLAFIVVNSLGTLIARHYYPAPKKSRNARRLKLLILRQRYYGADRRLAAPEYFVLDNTLRASGLADFEVLTYDSDLRISPISDLQLIRKCCEIRPDIVFLGSCSSPHTHPSVYALRFVRGRLGIPFAKIWWDTCNNNFWRNITRYIDAIDLHIVGDNPRGHCLDKAHPLFNRFLLLWAPPDPALFYSANGPRDIHVSFVGRVGAYRAYRREYLQYLTDHGIAGRFYCADEDGLLSHEQYAEILRRSRMCVNFSFSVDAPQCKARVLEAMLSGALLLESENDQTCVLFNPMEDYVPFSSKEDLLNKIIYFQAHPTEMETIARNGTHKVQSLYSSKAFWESIFHKAGLQ